MNNKHIGEIIYSEKEIQERVKEIARLINKDYKNKEPILIILPLS